MRKVIIYAVLAVFFADRVQQRYGLCVRGHRIFAGTSV